MGWALDGAWDVKKNAIGLGGVYFFKLLRINSLSSDHLELATNEVWEAACLASSALS